MTTDSKIQHFWTWFSANAPHFGDAFQNEELLGQLDIQVAELGDFAWEVGPGLTEENSLVLSPGGNKELLAATRKIVAAAPPVRGWEFHYAKPPKNWEPRFELQNENGIPVEINASDWRCVLLKHVDGSLEVLVEAPSLGVLNDVYKRWAAEIVLDGLLGEERRLEIVGEVSVVSNLPAQDRAFPIIELPERVA